MGGMVRVERVRGGWVGESTPIWSPIVGGGGGWLVVRGRIGVSVSITRSRIG